ncbi:hypothetical protein JCM19274_157 [Algibacter lectus]|uniref:Uncharacterized protein n=1 Tax=Algibacter lectus TaxID=221126 RepID=A0A090X6W2_9FLAO|nr:hypothetical protein JCM19274_157 [Algibacter lectus]
MAFLLVLSLVKTYGHEFHELIRIAYSALRISFGTLRVCEPNLWAF